jgi:AraC-like DNA-binding protein
MKTKSLLPPPSISSYVSTILVIENEETKIDFVIPLYANGSPTIVFQTGKATRQDHPVDNLILYGQTILPGELLFNEPFTLIAYFLHPHTLKSLFDIKAGELTDDDIDLNYLKKAKEINLREQLLNEQNLESRLRLLNDFILKLSNESVFDYSKIAFATNELTKSDSPHSLIELQKELKTSERSLQRLFESQVGVPPKMFKRIWQFHAAFQQLNQYQYSKLSDIAYGQGFADQSHFIRVFKEFTGLTPTEYLKKAAPYNPKF